MFANSLHGAIAAVVIGVALAHSDSVLAITGGVSVNDVLAARAGSRYTQQQVAVARAVAAVTVALINRDLDGQGASLCSASIVHPRVVLTAAHCVLNGKEVSQRMSVRFEGGASQRQALDAIVHPAFLKTIRSRAYKPQTQSLQEFMRTIEPAAMAADLALVLLHRRIPDAHDLVEPIARGFRDRRATKLIAGYGTIDGYRSMEKLALHFAELHSNAQLDEELGSGAGEIVMESRYRDGARVNTCKGDSGGPVFVVDPVARRLRQLAVTSAGDRHCREAAVFAPIDSQRAVLRAMFDALMDGELGAEQNPF